MALARLVPSQVRSRAAIDKRWPDRDRGSDGWIADRNHEPPSDHIPDPAGWVRATDTDKDGIHVPSVVADFILHPATKYLIWDERIYHRNDQFRPRAYYGKNPHTGHIHRSTLATREADRHTGSYPIIAGAKLAITDDTVKGAKGEGVRQLQALLNANGASLHVDGDFGDATDKALRAFQAKRKVKHGADGIPGRYTLAALTGRKP